MRVVRVLFALLCLTLATVALARTYDDPPAAPLWPDGALAPRPGITEQVTDNHPTRADRHVLGVTAPTLTPYLPADDRRDRAAVIVCPGGGYHLLALDKEGHDIARWLADHGVVGVVLKYRLPAEPTGDLAPIADGQQAVRVVRERAAEWGIDPNRVGVMGFSAGGHLAATVATRFDRPVPPVAAEGVSVRPDFQILLYPVVSFTDEIGHTGSRDKLLGPDPPAARIAEFSAERQVSADTLANLKTALDTILVTTPAGQLNRVHAALTLVMAAPEYIAQK